MKKFVMMILSLVMVFSLVSCSSRYEEYYDDNDASYNYEYENNLEYEETQQEPLYVEQFGVLDFDYSGEVGYTIDFAKAHLEAFRLCIHNKDDDLLYPLIKDSIMLNSDSYCICEPLDVSDNDFSSHKMQPNEELVFIGEGVPYEGDILYKGFIFPYSFNKVKKVAGSDDRQDSISTYNIEYFDNLDGLSINGVEIDSEKKLDRSEKINKMADILDDDNISLFEYGNYNNNSEDFLFTSNKKTSFDYSFYRNTDYYEDEMRIDVPVIIINYFDYLYEHYYDKMETIPTKNGYFIVDTSEYEGKKAIRSSGSYSANDHAGAPIFLVEF